MPSERVQRRIDALLDEADEALSQRDWNAARELADAALGFDPDNDEAKGFLRAAERALGGSEGTIEATTEVVASTDGPFPTTPADEPKSFASGRYTVSKFLGEGGKKRVYLAHDTLLGRDVAFALIKTEGFDQTSKERISREAQAMGRLGVHPNIVAVLDLGQEDDGSPYMVTELMGGGDVEGLLEEIANKNPVGADSDPPEGGPLPAPTRAEGLSLDRTIEIGKAVCEGLEFAHARGIVHRDLKPGNVWLTEDGTAKIGDFGLAVMTDRSRLTREGMMVGTVSYMPPEQATGGEITPKADLYSLGAMLYEMVTGRPPFLGDDEIAIIGQHINTAPVAPTWHNGTCPRPLEALIMRLLSKDPSERPESAQDVFNALDAIDLTARGETVERDANSLESLAGGVFVGRQVEMDQLKAALEDVLGGRGRLVTLVGEPGIGKTRTSEELATYAGLRGAQVLFGRCYEGGGAPPYWPWVQAIRSYVREIDADELRRQMGSSASVVAEIVTDVKDRLPELGPPPQLDDPDSARFRLFDSITSFLKTASQARPLVIVLDDLHWADRPSLAFLEFIARELQQSRVMLICTYRDMELNRQHPLSLTLGDLTRDHLYERVLLRGLTADDIGRFIEIAAGVTPPSGLVEAIFTQTEGNPLFVTEVVRLLVEEGELTPEKVASRTSWTVRIPEGVRDVIGRRLDRVSQRCNDVLTIASVIGREFTLDALRALTGPADENPVGANDYPPGGPSEEGASPSPQPSPAEGRRGTGTARSDPVTEGQLLDVLDEALDARIIEELRDAVGHYQFTHALIQETLNAELSITRRVRMQARIAETLESIYGERSDDHAAELAGHFAEAETVLGSERLFHYSRAAGERALAAYGYEEAIVHFERALVARSDQSIDGDEAAIRVGLGRAQAAAAMIADSADNLTRAVDFYLGADDVDKAAAALRDVHTVALATRLVDVFSRVIGRVSEDSDYLGHILASYGFAIGTSSSDYATARDALDRSVQLADQSGDGRLKALALANIANVEGFHLKWDSSYAYAREALALLPPDDASVTANRAHLWAGLAAGATGQPEEGLVHIDTACQAAERRHDTAWLVIGLSQKALIYCGLGDWERAEQTATEAIDLVGRLETNSTANAYVVRLQAAVWTGDRDRAEGVLKEALETSDVDDPLVSGLLALFFATAGHLLSVPEHISTASECLERTGEPDVPPIYAIWGTVASALIAIERTDETLASEARQRLATRRGAGGIGLLMTSDRLLGLLVRTLGDTSGSASHFEDALQFCRNAGHRPELAWTCSDYAEMLLDRTSTGSAQAEPGDREKAVELQDEALAITQELGMRPLTERILARREILRA